MVVVLRRAALGAVLLAGCGPDPALVAERDELAAKVTGLEGSNKRLEREADTLHAKVIQLQGELVRANRRVAFARLGVQEGETLQATLETSKGSIHCELWPTIAPITVLNFVELARGEREWTDPRTDQKVKQPLYDGTIFHRVLPEFMIQGGDPLGNGTGGPGYQFEDETDPQVTFREPGLLAMANSGPGTNGSQFFITDRATPTHLNGKHTIFGKCADQDVVQAIADAPRDPKRGDRPLEDVVLRRVVVSR